VSTERERELEAALRDLEERLERASLAWLAFEGGRDANGMRLLHDAVFVAPPTDFVEVLWNRREHGKSA